MFGFGRIIVVVRVRIGTCLQQLFKVSIRGLQQDQSPSSTCTRVIRPWLPMEFHGDIGKVAMIALDYEKVHFLKESSVRCKQNLSFPELKSSKSGITSKKEDGILGCLVGVGEFRR